MTNGIGHKRQLPEQTLTNPKNFYLEYMYGQTAGFISRAEIKKYFFEKLYSNEWLISRNRYSDVNDVYTSMNSFLSPKSRTVNNIKRYNALYLDLDIYKIGLSHSETLALLQREYIGKRIPTPTFIIDSGRGMYLIWKIDEDRNARPRWERVQRYLYEQCKDLGADSKALDGARILRVPTTVNSKNGATVSVIQFNNIEYTLHEIIKKYGIKKSVVKRKVTAKQRNLANYISKQLNVSLPDLNNYTETVNYISKYAPLLPAKKQTFSKPITRTSTVLSFDTTRFKGIVDDIQTLFKYRKGDNCNREYALFFNRLFVGQITGDYDFALESTKSLNRSFDVPYPESEVEPRTRSAERKLKSGSTYKYSNATIIEKLGITAEELTHLSYLNKEARTSRKETNRRAYLNHLAKIGKQTKKDTITARRQALLSLIGDGKTRAEICEVLNISLATYTKDKAVLIADGLLERAENAINTAVKEVSNNIKTQKERLLDVLCCLAKNKENSFLKTLIFATTFLSPNIIRENTEGVPHGFLSNRYIISTPLFLERQGDLLRFFEDFKDKYPKQKPDYLKT